MKKIRESFHMIATAVFCLVMSVKAAVLNEIGQALGLNKGSLGSVCRVQGMAGNKTASSMYRAISKHDNYIRKVFFWLKGPGDNKKYRFPVKKRRNGINKYEIRNYGM